MNNSDRIKFSKPDFKTLNSQGFTCVDMHVHSLYSDTFTTIERILKKCKENKLGVAITDHNNIKGLIKALKFREVKNKDILVIPGIEISSREGPHILLYFYSVNDISDFYVKHIHKNVNKDPYTSINLTVAEIIDRASKYSCIKSVAHPFNISYLNFYNPLKKGKMPEWVIKKIDAIEVISSLCLRKMNEKSIDFSNEYHKGITAGSDAHSLKDMGRAVSYSDADSVDTFLDNIRSNRNFVVGKETTNHARMYTYSKSVVKHMRHPVSTVHVRVRSKASSILNKRKVIKRHIRKKVSSIRKRLS